MNKAKLELLWNDIPVGAENAVDYPALSKTWGVTERRVREILHDLSLYDNGDNYILIRSAAGKGFYKTDDTKTLKAFKQECLSKGKSVFAPVKKINRVLAADCQQMTFENNLRVVREANGFKQSEVCKVMKKYDRQFDKSLLSKMENGVCMPTPYQLAKLARIYGVTAFELIGEDLYY